MSNAMLAGSPPETWGNTIIVRLALALNLIEVGFGATEMDADEVLELAEDVIWRYRELSK